MTSKISFPDEIMKQKTRREIKMTKQNKQTNRKDKKKGSVSNELAIILFFAGACLITLFILAFILLSRML